MANENQPFQFIEELKNQNKLKNGPFAFETWPKKANIIEAKKKK